jgi:hypothetical protein
MPIKPCTEPQVGLLHVNVRAGNSRMEAVFPESRKTLQEADPEVFDLVQAEKKRQWYVISSMMT